MKPWTRWDGGWGQMIRKSMRQYLSGCQRSLENPHFAPRKDVKLSRVFSWREQSFLTQILMRTVPPVFHTFLWRNVVSFAKIWRGKGLFDAISLFSWTHIERKQNFISKVAIAFHTRDAKIFLRHISIFFFCESTKIG